MEMSEQAQGGVEQAMGKVGDDGGRTPSGGEPIHDLLEDGGAPNNGSRGNQEIIVIDGRVYERVLKPEDKIYELNDIVERGRTDPFAGGDLNEATAKIVVETAEKIAREMFPGIAERILKEEIEKLKRDHGMGMDS